MLTKGRVNFTISASPRASECLDRLTDVSGVKKYVLLEKILEWFATQPEVVQASIISFSPELQTAAGRMVVEHMAASSPMS